MQTENNTAISLDELLKWVNGRVDAGEHASMDDLLELTGCGGDARDFWPGSLMVEQAKGESS